MTALASNLIWFGVVACWVCFQGASTVTKESESNSAALDADVRALESNNWGLFVVRGASTQSFMFTYRETGSTPTNFVATNRIMQTLQLHDGQEFSVTVKKL